MADLFGHGLRDETKNKGVEVGIDAVLPAGTNDVENAPQLQVGAMPSEGTGGAPGLALKVLLPGEADGLRHILALIPGLEHALVSLKDDGLQNAHLGLTEAQGAKVMDQVDACEVHELLAAPAVPDTVSKTVPASRLYGFTHRSPSWAQK